MTNISLDLSDLTDHHLLIMWDRCTAAIADAKERQGRAEMELRRRMEERNATAIPDEEYTCQLKAGTPIVDYNVLARLREQVAPAVLREGYSEPWEETITHPEKWNMVQVNTWRRFGDEVAAIIADSKTPGPPKFEVKRKE